MPAIHLTPKAVAQTALDNWERLGAVTGKVDCLNYYDDGCRCVIGMSLPLEVAQANRKGALRCLGNRKVVSWTEYDYDDLRHLQVAHDCVCDVELLEDRPKELAAFRTLCETLAGAEA